MRNTAALTLLRNSLERGQMRLRAGARYNRPESGNVWSPVGPVLDLWARNPVFKELSAAPNVKVTRDNTKFRFQVVGRNNANTTGYQMFLDYIRIGPPTGTGACFYLCASPPCPIF